MGDLLVEGDGEVAAVEGKEGQHVEGAENDVEDRQESDESAGTQDVGLRTDLGNADQTHGANLIGDRFTEHPLHQLRQ